MSAVLDDQLRGECGLYGNVEKSACVCFVVLVCFNLLLEYYSFYLQIS